MVGWDPTGTHQTNTQLRLTGNGWLMIQPLSPAHCSHKGAHHLQHRSRDLHEPHQDSNQSCFSSHKFLVLLFFNHICGLFQQKNTSDLTKTWSCPRNPGDSWWFPVSLWSFPSAKKTKKSCQSAKSDSKVAPTQRHHLKRWRRKKKAADEKFPWKLIKKMPWKMLVKRLSSCWNNPCFFETTFVHFPVG